MNQKYEKINIIELKDKTAKKTEKIKNNYLNQKSSINEIQSFKKTTPITKIPSHIIERYEKQFKLNKTRKTLKSTIIIFSILILISLFFRPSLVPLTNTTGIQNLTQRTIEDIKIINLTSDENTPYFETISGGDSKEFILKGGIYLVTAKRQLPIILTIPYEKEPKIKNPLEKKIEELSDK